MTQNFLWWRDGVIYQIYPRSFADSNGDGLGDLPGITCHLDYLHELGIDAIWLSPFYPTPDKDFGYDIRDYRAVDPRFGTLADFDTLLQAAHRRGIRVVLDMVLNHTSDQHPWFQEARASRSSPRRDWYIWRDRPNNWQASFGGPAWEFDPPTGQYYLHSFVKEQPDLNWRNPQVRQEMLDTFRFWLERGVDGFRLDVFNAYFKHPELPDNPPKFGLRAFDRQQHRYDMDQPEMHPLLAELRALLDAYPERYAVGETYLANPQKTISYCGPSKLHAAFSFDFTSHDLVYPWSAGWVADRIAQREKVFNAAGVWPTTVFSNHDLPRAASRYNRTEDDAQARIAMALLLTLRGTPFIYYGEEIGMRDITLGRSEILDPPGKVYWPIYKGRDGCRSPMQWDGSRLSGFTQAPAAPWLPIHHNQLERNVQTQLADPHSLLHFTKKLLALRKAYPALQRGSLELLPGLPSSILAYLRQAQGQTILVAANFSRRQASFTLPAGQWELLFAGPPAQPPAIQAGACTLTGGQVCLLLACPSS